jgi:hypothetical protein
VFATGFLKTGLEHATLQRPTVSELFNSWQRDRHLRWFFLIKHLEQSPCTPTVLDGLSAHCRTNSPPRQATFSGHQISTTNAP